jgi:hypothetical protein
VRHALGRNLPFPGGGYQFELAEVTRCVGLGLRESPVMPLEETLEVVRQMDSLRGDWGMKFEHDV